MTFVFVASAGSTEASIFEVSPSFKFKLSTFNFIPVTSITFSSTFISILPDTPLPSVAVAVIVAVPTATAVIFPFSSTVTIELLLLDHVTFLSFASVGITTTSHLIVSPGFNVVVLAFIVMFDTFIFSFTVTVLYTFSALFPASST